MTTVLRATDPASFLALVPVLAGFTPSESVVLLPFHGNRCHGAMRLDLPDAQHRRAFARDAIDLLERVSGIDGAAIVLYSDQNAGSGHLPAARIVRALEETLEARGLHLIDALGVTRQGWGSYLRPRSELRSLAHIPPPPPVMGVADVHGNQDSGAALPDIASETRDRVARTLRDLEACIRHPATAASAAVPSDDVYAASERLEDMPAFFESVLDSPQHLPVPVAAALLWCLDRPLLRDAALLQWACDLPTGRLVLEAQLAHADGREVFPEHYGRILLGQGERPDSDRLRVALSVLREAAAVAPDTQRKAPLTLAAWLSWALGRTSHAAMYLEQVAELDPGYSMADLVRTLISAAVLPDWAFRRADE